MQYSKQGLTLTESFEGCRLVAYQDSTGIWTIGYGHTRGVYAGMTCTQAQAEQWLIQDTSAAVNNVNAHVTTQLTQDEFDALVDFDFNLGDGTLDRSNLLSLVNQRRFTEAATLFDQYDHAGGKVVAGLLRRRVSETTEFSS